MNVMCRTPTRLNGWTIGDMGKNQLRMFYWLFFMTLGMKCHVSLCFYWLGFKWLDWLVVASDDFSSSFEVQGPYWVSASRKFLERWVWKFRWVFSVIPCNDYKLKTDLIMESPPWMKMCVLLKIGDFSACHVSFLEFFCLVQMMGCKELLNGRVYGSKFV